ncbi:MAG TPA: SDR family oxidoreductase [Terriglobales bacterium]|nr:SDR family oxidoreductase [Terriglobales bacterium]
MKKTEARPESLAGKVAVVTGASRGIGCAVAAALVAAECTVIAASRTLSATRNKSASRPAGTGLTPVTEIRCDVRDEASVALLFAKIREQFGCVDILVNNAGTAHALRNIEELPPEVWREVIDTNLTGMFLCTQAALPLMSKGAVIVNNLSVAARGVFPGESAYCASKFGALGFTETLREEVRERGIRVIALLPGATATDIWNKFMPEAPREKMMSAETVARALVNAITLPENAAVEELRLASVAGKV